MKSGYCHKSYSLINRLANLKLEDNVMEIDWVDGFIIRVEADCKKITI